MPGRVARRPPPARLHALGSALIGTLLVLEACSVAPSGQPTTGPVAPASPAVSQAAVASAPSCTQPAAADIPPWRDRVFYEVFVRSFADSDGDGVGDLRGLTAHLDYLNDGDPATTGDLGVTGIWLMPVAEAASYHGYDVTNYTAVEADYGSSADLRAFVQAAHERGILVIVDFVINHTSSHHPWFEDALAGGAHRDWYIWSEADPGWPAVAGPNPWHRASDGSFFYGAFWDGMPDLNLRNPDVTAEIGRIAGIWLDDLGVDGFRIDAAKHLIEAARDQQVNTPETHAWLASFREAVHANHPDALVLGEVWDGRAITSGYTADGALDVAFDFGIGSAISTGVYGDATTLLASLDEVSTRYAPGAAATFLSNHDQPRIATQLRGDLEAARRAGAVLLTGPGIPFVYYGEELGLTGAKPDERIRTPFPWTAEGPGFGFTAGTPWEAFEPGAESANVATEAADPASVLSVYRELIQLRAAHPALGAGTLVRVKASNPSVAATLRSHGDERLLVIHNLGAEPVAGVSFDLELGSLCGAPTARTIYPAAAAVVAPAPRAPAVTATGGFAGYVPLPELAAGSTIVVDLSR